MNNFEIGRKPISKSEIRNLKMDCPSRAIFGRGPIPELFESNFGLRISDLRWAFVQFRNSLFELFLPAILWVIRIGSAEEQPLTIFEGDVGAIRSILTILRAIAFNRDLSSGQQRFLSEAAPEQDIRAAAFHHPRDNFAFRPRYVHVNPSVRIDPFHLLNFALKFHGLIDVKLGRKSVVCPHSRSE